MLTAVKQTTTLCPSYMKTIHAELITEAIAAELLEHVDLALQRRLNHGAVDAYSTDIVNGDWKDNVDSNIVISDTGKLLNGQTRCNAIIQSGVALWLFVVRGVPEDLFDGIDRGKTRTLADTLHNPAAAAATSLLAQYESGISPSPNGRHTTAQKLDVFRRHPAFIESVNYVRKQTSHVDCLKPIRRYRSILALCHYLGQPSYAALSNRFIDQMCDGFGMQDGNAIVPVRTHMLTFIDPKKRTMTEKQINILIAQAFNLYLRQEPAPNKHDKNKNKLPIAGFPSINGGLLFGNKFYPAAPPVLQVVAKKAAGSK